MIKKLDISEKIIEKKNQTTKTIQISFVKR